MLGNRVMTVPLEACFDRLQLTAHPFRLGASGDGELLIPVASATDVHKPQERKRLWLPHPPPKREQTRFVRVQHEAKDATSLGDLAQKARRLVLALEAQHDILGITAYDHITPCVLTPPRMTPQVKDVMPIEV